jgi:hypothetical protein
VRQIAALLLCVLLMYSSSFAATQPAPVILYDINGNPYNEDVTERCPENRRALYSTTPTGGTDAMIAADQLYKSGPGYVRSITCYSDATATAGTIALRDNTAAGAGNILWSFDVLAVAYNTPFTVDLQTPFSVGLYLDFTTTADMKCMVRFR